MDWRQALDKHRNLLHEHLAIWQMIQIDAQPGSKIHDTAQQCLQHTQAMIEACEDVKALGDNSPDQTGDTASNLRRSSEEPEKRPTAKKAKKIEANDSRPSQVSDPSGLFMIDTNPTDVNTLLNAFQGKSKKSKRQFDHSHTPPTKAELDPIPLEIPTAKRKKSQQGIGEEVSASLNEIDAQHKAFERKVELRLKEKEEQRQKKSTKKRKRESDGSTFANGSRTAESKSGRQSNLAPLTTENRESNQSQTSENRIEQASDGASVTGRNRKKRRKRNPENAEPAPKALANNNESSGGFPNESHGAGSKPKKRKDTSRDSSTAGTQKRTKS